MSDDEDFSNALTNLRDFFTARNYPEALIDLAFNEVCKLSQNEAVSRTSTIVQFIFYFGHLRSAIIF